MKQNKILITGFKSYKDKNSSEYLIDNINADCDKFLFTNDYTTIIYEIDEVLFQNNYEYIIMFGQKPLIKNICLELVAKHKKEILKTNFSLDHITKFLDINKINYKLSESPKTSYCNFLYYNMLKCTIVNDKKAKIIFIHIPFMNNFEKIKDFILTLEKLIAKLRK